MVSDPYAPCPCGSGKKYKFCCRQKQRDRAAGRRPFAPVLSTAEDFGVDDGKRFLVGDLDEGSQHFNQAFKRMQKGDYAKAIPSFRRAIDAAPFIPAPYNNLALCLFIEGDVSEAVQIQNEGLRASPMPNPFGLCNLATFHLALDQREKAGQCLEEGMGLPLPNADACVKVCEVLARFKRHQDILCFADASDHTEDEGVCFFTGIAAANLGLRDRARSDLRHVGLGHPKAEMAARYYRCLNEDASPHTVLEDWPYLQCHEILPIKAIEAQLKKNESEWISRRVAVDFCEASLNEAGDRAADVMDLVCSLTHTEVRSLLWALVKGSFGPDELRLRAFQRLDELGELKRGEPVSVLINGKPAPLASMGVRLNPDVRFGPRLTPALDKRYAKAIRASRRPFADWGKQGELFRQIMQEAPGFFPARLNYAVSLLHRERFSEAESILRDLIEAQPEYLFAPAALLQVLTSLGRLDDGQALITSVSLPEETHPDALLAWMAAQAVFFTRQGLSEEADRCFEIVRKLNPNHPVLSGMGR